MHFFSHKLCFCFFQAGSYYGYTAYSASKCGFQGSGEALQQQVISDHDIHVTLLFPPDTDTPGFEQGKTIQNPFNFFSENH